MTEETCGDDELVGATCPMNTPSTTSNVALACHPECIPGFVEGIEARVELAASGTLVVNHSLSGKIEKLRVSTAGPVRRGDNLWQHTCFEIFIAAAENPGYYEFNFSPSGEWAIYRFFHYRERAPVENMDRILPSASWHHSSDLLTLYANIDLNDLPEIARIRPMRLGVSAVIEDENGSLSYWALKHPASKPDFHHPEGFALAIPPLPLTGGALRK